MSASGRERAARSAVLVAHAACATSPPVRQVTFDAARHARELVEVTVGCARLLRDGRDPTVALMWLVEHAGDVSAGGLAALDDAELALVDTAEHVATILAFQAAAAGDEHAWMAAVWLGHVVEGLDEADLVACGAAASVVWGSVWIDRGLARRAATAARLLPGPFTPTIRAVRS